MVTATQTKAGASLTAIFPVATLPCFSRLCTSLGVGAGSRVGIYLAWWGSCTAFGTTYRVTHCLPT
jgi:hypothetical protein